MKRASVKLEDGLRPKPVSTCPVSSEENWSPAKEKRLRSPNFGGPFASPFQCFDSPGVDSLVADWSRMSVTHGCIAWT